MKISFGLEVFDGIYLEQPVYVETILIGYFSYGTKKNGLCKDCIFRPSNCPEVS